MKTKFKEKSGYTNVKMDKAIFFEEVENHDLDIKYNYNDLHFQKDVQILEQKGNDVIIRVDRRIKHWLQTVYSRYEEL